MFQLPVASYSSCPGPAQTLTHFVVESKTRTKLSKLSECQISDSAGSRSQSRSQSWQTAEIGYSNNYNYNYKYNNNKKLARPP